MNVIVLFMHSYLVWILYDENVTDNLWNMCFGGFSVSNIYVEGLHFLLLLIRECSECLSFDLLKENLKEMKGDLIS